MVATDDQAILHTTLRLIKEQNACERGYAKLRRALGKGWLLDKPINLLAILDSNGAADCIWALRATTEPCERQARLIAADCAEMVLPLFEGEAPDDRRPRRAIEVARRFVRGEAAQLELDAASDAASGAAWAVARAAAWVAARAAAWAAASDAARAATWAAARAAAWAAASDAASGAARDAARDAAWAAAKDAQANIIRRYLLPDEEETSL